MRRGFYLAVGVIIQYRNVPHVDIMLAQNILVSIAGRHSADTSNLGSLQNYDTIRIFSSCRLWPAALKFGTINRRCTLSIIKSRLSKQKKSIFIDAMVLISVRYSSEEQLVISHHGWLLSCHRATSKRSQNHSW